MTIEKQEVIGNYEVDNEKLTTRREILMMGALVAGGTLIAAKTNAAAQTATASAIPSSAAGTGSVAYKAKDFSHLVNTPMDGLKPDQIEPHLKLYSAYVSKANEIQDLITNMDVSKPKPNPTYAPFRELLMEQSYALNGVIYHELYFGNLGGQGGEPAGDLRSAIDDRWGSFGKFMDHFKAAGKCMRGWVIVGWNTRDGHLHTYGLDLHNMWVPANVVPIVVLDVYEHAYMIQYGINRGAYLDAFLKHVDWACCDRRLLAAHKHQWGPETTA